MLFASEEARVVEVEETEGDRLAFLPLFPVFLLGPDEISGALEVGLRGGRDSFPFAFLK